MESQKPPWRSKTLWFGLAIGILGVFQSTIETVPLDPKLAGVILSVIGAIVMVLRGLTGVPIASIKKVAPETPAE